jgi:hypothetical protein
MKTTIDLWHKVWPDPGAFVRASAQDLERFEALVRADEREACAKVCESEAEMFKSCAYGANDGRYDWKEDGARDCAAAIRARGNT